MEVGDEREEGKPSGPLEEKVKRLESLLSKCKENIKANKQKTAALTEVKEQLASDLALREQELAEERAKAQKVNAEMELLKGRYRTDVHHLSMGMTSSSFFLRKIMQLLH